MNTSGVSPYGDDPKLTPQLPTYQAQHLHGFRSGTVGSERIRHAAEKLSNIDMSTLRNSSVPLNLGSPVPQSVYANAQDIARGRMSEYDQGPVTLAGLPITVRLRNSSPHYIQDRLPLGKSSEKPF